MKHVVMVFAVGVFALPASTTALASPAATTASTAGPKTGAVPYSRKRWDSGRGDSQAPQPFAAGSEPAALVRLSDLIGGSANFAADAELSLYRQEVIRPPFTCLEQRTPTRSPRGHSAGH